MILSVWQKQIHRTILLAALVFCFAALSAPASADQPSGQEAAAKQELSVPKHELVVPKDEIEVSEQKAESLEPKADWSEQSRLLRKVRWMARPGDDNPIVLDNSLRRPFLFFRDAINQRWPLGRLFFITMLAAVLAKVFAPNMVAGALDRCRKKFLICLASAFIYTTVLLSVARQAFQTEALVPMALGCIALVQLSYIVGMGLGINIFANIVSNQIGKRFGHLTNGTKSKTFCRWLALIATVALLTAISAIPELGRLPRLGNRLVVLVAIIGLGGLISDTRAKSRNRESE
ncbi:hypothetical protein BH11CYA1_BH11CYA1_35580 [soil metagenome]